MRRHPATILARPFARLLLALCCAALLLPLIAPQRTRAAFAATDVALVIDVSGSMEILAEIPADFPNRDEYRQNLQQLNSFLEGGSRKRSLREVIEGVGSGIKLAQLEQDVNTYLQSHNLDLKEQSRLGAAKRAAKSYLDLLELSKQSGATSRVSLVTFGSTLNLNTPLTDNYASTRQSIDTLTPLGGTNMGAGIQAALDQLSKSGGDTRKQIILLTDGYNNEGMTNEQVLAGPVATAKSRGIPIFTIGLGLLPQTVDGPFLAGIAQQTGGAYSFVDSPEALNATLLSYQSFGDSKVLGRYEGSLQPRQTVQLGSVNVANSNQSLRMSYRVSKDTQVGLDLTRPDGRMLNKSDPNVKLAKQGDVTVLTIANPQPGDWQLQVTRQDLGQSVARYAVVASTEGKSEGLPIALVVTTYESPERVRQALIFASAGFGLLIVLFAIMTGRGLFGRRASRGGGCLSGCLTLVLIVLVALGWGGYWLWNQPLFGT